MNPRDIIVPGYRTPTVLGGFERNWKNDPLTQEYYEAMKRSAGSWKNTLLLMFLRNTGFRPVEVSRLEVRHFIAEGPIYYVVVRRAKKRKLESEWEPVILNPNLGHALKAHIDREPHDQETPLFGVRERRILQIVSEAGEKGIGRPVMVKEFRRFYVRTVAEIAPRVLGFTPQHMQVAQKMVGHEHVSTTWDWYFDLSMDDRRRIQEQIPV